MTQRGREKSKGEGSAIVIFFYCIISKNLVTRHVQLNEDNITEDQRDREMVKSRYASQLTLS